MGASISFIYVGNGNTVNVGNADFFKKWNKIAIDIFCYRLAKYIAAYLVPLKKIDGVIFTGGIGENSEVIRTQVMEQLTPFNLKALVIPTNEELMIAQDAAAIVKEAS